jgi:hypothetical protein
LCKGNFTFCNFGFHGSKFKAVQRALIGELAKDFMDRQPPQIIAALQGIVSRRINPSVPAGLTAPAWHLFAIFVASIAAVLVGAFPLLTSTMLAVAAVVLTDTIQPTEAVRVAKNIRVISVGSLLGEAIKRTAGEESVSTLFD